MFEKFGEFDSYEGINALAANLKTEGDEESILALAEENGIDEGIARMFMAGGMTELCDAFSAAFGKIIVEERDLKPEELMRDWTEYLKAECMEDMELCAAVRRKGKNLKGMVANILKWSFGHQKDVEKDIIKAAGITAGRVTFGIPGMGRAKRLIREYYFGGGK